MSDFMHMPYGVHAANPARIQARLPLHANGGHLCGTARYGNQYLTIMLALIIHPLQNTAVSGMYCVAADTTGGWHNPAAHFPSFRKAE